MTTAIDSGVLFDVLLDDRGHAASSQAALRLALATGPAVICCVVYAELAAAFTQADEVEAFRRDVGVKLDPGRGADALRLAATAWRR